MAERWGERGRGVREERWPRHGERKGGEVGEEGTGWPEGGLMLRGE